MNKLLIVARRMAIITFLLTSVYITAHAHITPLSESTVKSTVPSFSEQDIKERLDNMSSVIDLNYTDEVGRRIREYTVNYRKAGEKILGRVGLYFPLFEREIHSRNLPDELKYVAVVESNLVPTAKSSSGALGLWQFIKSTGRMQGLKMDQYVDERRDPEKSTKAALDYLSDLYDQFGDWTLAIAAYNCGPGGVRKAIRRGNSRNYWEIRKHMPRETQKYVPRIIAAIYLMQYYHHHNLSPESVDSDMVHTVSIADGKKHNLYTLAKNLELDYKMLKALNPQFKTKYLPKNSGHYALVIPKSRYDLYLSQYNKALYKATIAKRQKEEMQKRMKTEMEYLEKQRKQKVKKLAYISAIEPRQVYSSNYQASVNISY
ncbi:MAG: transglycosylase SLT domain-containing protein [Saprospiraceae bacterium]|nr:transglycosylase SLT domain-containing protein [Bacteroidia bacterium]NNE15378.1 transglycosylase SLT domain-containing protein [Saprospiraceae bacterium]NNL93427.1 transglycosylase SLT domain-containing protein [Saprospiraceae bacterium]